MQLIRILRSILVAISILLPGSILAQATYKATADINIRSGPGTGYSSIGVVPKGKKIEVIDSSNTNWFKAKYNGITGYVTHKYIVREPVKIAPAKKSSRSPAQPPKRTRYLSILGWILFVVSLVLLIIGLFNRGKRSAQQVKSTPASPQRKNSSSSQPAKATTIPPSKQTSIPVSGLKTTIQSQNNTPSEKMTSGDAALNKQSAIEDVTGKAQPILNTGFSSSMVQSDQAPYWRQQYVYSAREINIATPEQKAFYKRFKNEFLQNRWLDLLGNSNYAFILLFDLLEDYKSHKNLDQLENQYRFLWKNWPKVESYARDILTRQMRLVGDNQGISRLDAEKPRYNTNFSFQESYWGLGSRNKEKLKLNNDQVKLLNALTDFGNSFNSLEYCARQIIFAFFHVLDELDKQFKNTGSSFEDQATAIGEMELIKHYRFKKGSLNYKSQLAEFPNTIRQIIYKTCENSLRDFLFVGRKTDLSNYIHSAEATQQFNTAYSGLIHELLERYFSGAEPPDDATEAELNQYSKSRWKSKLEILKVGFDKSNPQLFYDAVLKLGDQNKKNPSVENLFLEASKFTAKSDATISLKLYIFYIYHDLLSTTFDNRQLTKTIQKSLFQTADQVKEFQEIINDLIHDKNVEKALERIPGIYKAKRKKIRIDTSKIKEVQEQHAETVGLLNEYLQDEEIVEQPSESKNAGLNITLEVPESDKKSLFKEDVGLNLVQAGALMLMVKNGFTSSYTDLESFARENGVFRNSLIEGINETCFPIFDDILIEDEDGAYRINESYYQQILAS